MTIRVEISARGHGRTSRADASKLASWHGELFAPDRHIIDAFTWQDKRDMGFDIHSYRDDELVGSAHVFARIVRCDDAPALMGGLGSVMTSRDHQGQGIGGITVRKAGELILGNLQADLGILLCKPALVAFYERHGWRSVAVPVLIDQPDGKARWPHRAMVLLRDAQATVPRGLDLCGPPF